MCCVLGKRESTISSPSFSTHVCFREDTKVSHYIINKIQQGDQTVFRIGDQSFSDLPELLAFYKLHYLDTTPLRRPAQKKVEKVIGKFDFDGSVSKSRCMITHHASSSTSLFRRILTIWHSKRAKYCT